MAIFMPQSFYSCNTAPHTYWIGDWMNPSAGLYTLDKIEISCSCLESNPRTLSSLAQCYNNQAIPAPQTVTCNSFISDIRKNRLGSSASKTALKVYLLLFPIGKKKEFLLRVQNEKFLYTHISTYNKAVNGNIKFALWDFTIWTNFQTRFPSVYYCPWNRHWIQYYTVTKHTSCSYI
jgi:hypothetical protein